MVSSADVTERLMARFEGQIPLPMVGEVVRRAARSRAGDRADALRVRV